QKITGATQARERGAETRPDKHGALHGKREGNPFAIQAERNRQGSEREWHTGVQKSHQRWLAGFWRWNNSRYGDVSSGEGERRQRQQPAGVRPRHDVQSGEGGQGIAGEQ